MSGANHTINDQRIPACLHLKTESKTPPILILAQLHGNEPAGLAGILLAMALHEAKFLKQDVLCMIGNTLASEQYFSAYSEAPKARQEIRDAYRCGLGAGGVLLPDMNRIPSDFMEGEATTPHVIRARELFMVGQHVSGILDIHSARGNMCCITDHKHNSELIQSPIRSVLVGLAEAISSHTSTQKTVVRTLKTILHPLPNIKYQVGIEAGRHEAVDTPYNAATFTLAFLHTIGVSSASPTRKKESGIFDCYHVQPKWNYSDLQMDGKLQPEDKIYMCVPCLSVQAIPKRSDRVVVKKKDGTHALQTIMQYIVQPAGDLKYAIYQYDEMEIIQERAVVAIALPSGTTLRSPATVAGIFFSKPASLYDKDPAVGPWPVHAAYVSEIKFCYPCLVMREKLDLAA